MNEIAFTVYLTVRCSCNESGEKHLQYHVIADDARQAQVIGKALYHKQDPVKMAKIIEARAEEIV